MRVRILALLLAAAATAGQAAPPSTCGGKDDARTGYDKALCAYQQRRFADAEAGFRAIVEANAREPQTLHAVYFLARTQMKTGRFDEAATLLVRIHELDPAFYAMWSCDYLLGECRRATGKD
jgi:TolA-binding protein